MAGCIAARPLETAEKTVAVVVVVAVTAGIAVVVGIAAAAEMVVVAAPVRDNRVAAAAGIAAAPAVHS